MQPDAGLPLPDVTLYLTLSPEAAAKRSAYGEERYESVSIQQAVRQQFKLVADEIKKRHGSDKWIEIEADGTIEDVEERIWSQISDVVEHSNGDIGDLWSG